MSQGQQPGFLGEQPTQGYSVALPPAAGDQDAIAATVQEGTLRRAWPVKAAMGPPAVVVKAGMMLVTVETVAMLSVITAVGATKGRVGATEFTELTVDRGEHPKKSGMLTL